MNKLSINRATLSSLFQTPLSPADGVAIPAILDDVISRLPEPAWVTDRSHRWVCVNRAYCDYMGRPREVLLGATTSDVLTGVEAAAAWDCDETAFNAGESTINETQLADDGPRFLQTRKSVVRGATGEVLLLSMIRDLTGTDEAHRLQRGDIGVPAASSAARPGLRRLATGQVRFAFSDPLTQLPNRRATMSLIDSQTARADGESVIFLIDIDHFNLVNDRFGHSAGDAVIRELAQRLRSSIGPADMLGRLDNDAFIVVVEQCDLLQADELAECMLQDIARPMLLDDHEYKPSASIGIAHSPEHGRSADDLIRSAGLAMRRAKDRRRGGSELYSQSTSDSAARRTNLELRLPIAIERAALGVHYQPIIDRRSNELAGFEALVRWCDPDLGDIEPAEFIPIAEGMGAIRGIGQLVIDDACAVAASLADNSQVISINVSSVQLLDETLPIFIAETLQKYEISGERLLLEITETVAMEADGAVMQVFKELCDLGIRLFIDDFGTGFSNLARLKELPFTGIKVDRAFVQGLPESTHDEAIFRATCAIATAMDMLVIVEGIETEKQEAFVRDFDVQYLQGYRFGRPQPATRFERGILKA